MIFKKDHLYKDKKLLHSTRRDNFLGAIRVRMRRGTCLRRGEVRRPAQSRGVIGDDIPLILGRVSSDKTFKESLAVQEMC